MFDQTVDQDQLHGLINDAANCVQDVRMIADHIKSYSCEACEHIARSFMESGQASSLGIFLNACAVNELCMDPCFLADALRVADPCTDIIIQYKFQTDAAMEPLIDVALADDVTVERILTAAMILTELAVTWDTKRDVVERVLKKLKNKYEYNPEFRICILEYQSIIKMDMAAIEKENIVLGIEKKMGDIIPESRPPSVIGGSYTVRRAVEKIGRNDPCHCGSGKKYKKCCIEKDARLLRDSSHHQGLTLSELKQAPELVDDANVIQTMEPYELRKLIPEKLNEDQLFAASRRMSAFGLREKGFAILKELTKRPGQRAFAEAHMIDLLQDCIDSHDLDLAEKVKSLISKEAYESETPYEFGLFLLKSRPFIDELENYCKQAFEPYDCFIGDPFTQLCYHFEKIAPALSIAFGRAFIIARPESNLDAPELIKVIRNARLDLGLDTMEDPVEIFYSHLVNQDEEQLKHILREYEIELRELEADEKVARAEDQLDEISRKEKWLKEEAARIEKEKQSVNTPPVRVPAKVIQKKERQPSASIAGLKERIERLKQEVRDQQEKRRDLKRELDQHQALKQQTSTASDQVQGPDDHDELSQLDTFSAKAALIPVYSDKFRKSCGNLDASVTAKALKATTGFAVRDPETLKYTRKIESASGLFRIKIEPRYRVMVACDNDTLDVLDVIHRKELERWLKYYDRSM